MTHKAKSPLSIASIMLLFVFVSGAVATVARDDLYLAMTQALLDDKEELWRGFQSLTNGEPSYTKSLWLRLISSLPSSQREKRLQEFKRIKKLTPDKTWKMYMEYQLSNDELNFARRLGSKKIYTFLTGIFNYFSSLIAQALQGNVNLFLLPLSPIKTALASASFSAEERNALILFNKSLSKYRENEEKESTNKTLGKLRTKQTKYLARQNYVQARLLLRTGNYDQALFFADRALSFRSDSRKLSKLKNYILKAQARNDRHQSLSVQVVDGESKLFPENQEKLYYKIMCTLLKDEPLGLEKLFLDFYPMTSLPQFSDELDFARAAQFAADGNKRRAKSILYSLAKEQGKANTGRKASMLLHSPYYDAYEELQQAKKEAKKNLRRYIFTGKMPLKARLDVDKPISQVTPVDEINSLFQVIFIPNTMLRGIQSLCCSNPVFYDDLLDAGRKALRQRDYPEKAKLAQLLTSIYEKQKQYEVAEQVYKEAGLLIPEKQRELKEKQAKYYFRISRQLKFPEQKKPILEVLRNDYPQTKYATKAEKELVKVNEELNLFCQLPTKELRDTPGLWRNQGLWLDAELLDGNKKNDEIDSQGVTIYKDGRVAYTLCSGKKRQYQLDQQDHEILEVMLKERAVEKEWADSLKNYFKERKSLTIEIKGSVGTHGFLAYPAVQPLPYGTPQELIYR